MKKIYLLLTVLFFSQLFNFSISQKLELEKTYEITGKSKRGYLGKVEYDAGAKVYSLIYVTKASDKKAKFETYQFDKDFNFIQKLEDEIEFDKARAKYKWFNFKGDSYSVEAISVSGNLTGTLVLKKKRITYTYNWFFGGYDKKVELLEKVKPKNDEGAKYFYWNHVEDDVTGDIIVLTGIKGDKNDPYRNSKDFAVLKFNKDFDKIKETSVKFDHIQTTAIARSIPKVYEGDNENTGVGGVVWVFAPMGGPGMNKVANDNKNAYTYVRVNENAELVDRVAFTSPATYWKIDELVQIDSDNAVYVFGPAAEGKDKYYNMSLDITKFKSLQLMKIKDGKLAYITSTNLDEMSAKVKTPPSQKKSPEYSGKKFDIKGYSVAHTGEFFIYGQNFDNGQEGPKYRDVICFHFDKDGVLKSQYGVDTKETNQYATANGAPQFLQEGSNGKDVYWILTEIDGVKVDDMGTNHAKPRFLIYPRVGKVNLETGTIGDLVTLGKVEKKTFYLDNKFPYLPVEDGNALVFFGNDKSGKVLWFGKLRLE